MMSLLRYWRQRIPSRTSEILAALSLTTTFMLFIHTSYLQSQLQFYSNQLASTGDERTAASAHFESQEKTGTTHEKRFHYRHYNLDNYRHLDPSTLNVTKPDAKLILVFNRVPKVGSQSTMELLRTLSYDNGFTFHKDRPQKTENIKLSLREEKRLVDLVSAFHPPAVYVKHVCYINFTALHATQPIYINMVRDPVERAISWYYYVRAPWYFIERKEAFPDLSLPSSAWLRKDYETCVKNGDKECRYEEGQVRPDFAQLSEFFCGQDPQCTGFNTEFAVKRAIENVERHYAVVGILEEINMTLTVFEHYLPRFFKGAKDVYNYHKQKLSSVNRNIYKPKVDEKVKEIVRKNFTREIEFYEFCRQRLYKQYAALNLPSDDYS